MRTPVILYSRQRSSSTQRAGAVGAVLASVLLPWWLTSMLPASSNAAAGARAALDPARPNPPRDDWRAPIAATPVPIEVGGHRAAAAIATRPTVGGESLPYRYVGQWAEGRTTTIVLRTGGVNVAVRVPGSIDPRFDARSVDERRVLLWDRELRRDVELPLTAAASVPDRRPEHTTRVADLSEATPDPSRPPAVAAASLALADAPEPEN
jgi:hypothetical protein